MSDDAQYTAEDIARLRNLVMMAIDKQFDQRPPDGYVPREDVKDAVQGAFDPYDV